VPVPSAGTFSIYNLLGQTVYQESREFDQGEQLLIWNGTNNQGWQLPSGLYFYQISNGTQTIVRKMIILR